MSEADEFVRMVMGEGERRVQEIIENAKKQAEEILREAEGKARKIAEERARIVRETLLRKMIDERKRQLLSDKVKLKEAKMRELREILLSRIRDIVSGRDRRWDYTRILYLLLREAVAEIGTEKVIVSANARDLEFIRTHRREIERKLEEDLGRKVELVPGSQLELVGGVVCSSPSGDKIHHATLDGRIEEALRKNMVVISRKLGMVSQNRFRALTRRLFGAIDRELKIRDAMGRELRLNKMSDIESIVTEHMRIDLLCTSVDGKTIAVYATLGQATSERINKLIDSIKKLEKERNIEVHDRIFIAFSGVQEKDAEKLLEENNIYLLTKRELIELSESIKAGVF